MITAQGEITNIKQKITESLLHDGLKKSHKLHMFLKRLDVLSLKKNAIIEGLQNCSFVLPNIGELFQNTGLIKYNELKTVSLIVNEQKKSNLHLKNLNLKIMRFV